MVPKEKISSRAGQAVWAAGSQVPLQSPRGKRSISTLVAKMDTMAVAPVDSMEIHFLEVLPLAMPASVEARVMCVQAAPHSGIA